MTPRVRALLATVTLGSACASQVPTQAQVVARLRAIQEGVSSVKVSMRSEVDTKGHYIFMRLFLSGSEVTVDTGHGWPDHDWSLNFRRSWTHVANGVYRVNWPNLVAYEERALVRGEAIERIATQPWFRGSALWLQNRDLGVPEYGGVPTSVLAALERAEYEVSAAADSTEHLLLARTGVDKIWLDPRNGYCLVRREFISKDRVAMRVEVLGTRALTPALTLPVRWRISTFYDEASRGLRERPVTDFVTEVEELDINTMNESDPLEWSPAGLFKIDRSEPQLARQVTAGGLAMIEDHAAGMFERWRRKRLRMELLVGALCLVPSIWILLRRTLWKRRGGASRELLTAKVVGHAAKA